MFSGCLQFSTIVKAHVEPFPPEKAREKWWVLHQQDSWFYVGDRRNISQGIPAVIFPGSYKLTRLYGLPPLMEPQTCRKVAGHRCFPGWRGEETMTWRKLWRTPPQDTLANGGQPSLLDDPAVLMRCLFSITHTHTRTSLLYLPTHTHTLFQECVVGVMSLCSWGFTPPVQRQRLVFSNTRSN